EGRVERGERPAPGSRLGRADLGDRAGTARDAGLDGLGGPAGVDRPGGAVLPDRRRAVGVRGAWRGSVGCSSGRAAAGAAGGEGAARGPAAPGGTARVVPAFGHPDEQGELCPGLPRRGRGEGRGGASVVWGEAVVGTGRGREAKRPHERPLAV